MNCKKEEPSKESYHEWVKKKTHLNIDEVECKKCKTVFDKTLEICPKCGEKYGS